MCCLRLIYKLIVSFGAVLFWFWLSAPLSAATLDRVVGKVNSEIITLSAVEGRAAVISSRIKASNSLKKQPTKSELMKNALNTIIDEKLQVQEAKKTGLKVDEETVQTALEDVYKNNNITGEQFKALLIREGRDLESYKKAIRGQILASKITQMEVGSGTIVNESDIREYYIRNKKDYWVPAQRIVSHIMFIQEKGVSGKEARLKERKAQEVLQRIRSGEDFSELAKKYSEDVSSHSGGQIGTVARGTMMPEFEAAAFSLKVGEVSNIVKTQNGLHIIQCDKILSGRFKAYKEVSPEIKRFLDVNKREKKYEKWMMKLRRSAFIETTLVEGAPKLKKIGRSDNEFLGGDEVKETAKTKTPRKARRLPKSQKKFTEDIGSVNRHTIESKLKHYKKLRDSRKISERTYQEKKKELLKRL